MKVHRNTIWLIPLLLFVTFPLWSIPVSDFLTPRGGFDPDLKAGKEKTRQFNMDRVKILQNQDGQKTALIRAEKAQTGKNEDTLLMEKVNADIFDEDGNVTNIVANRGRYSTVTKILTLTDDVVVNRIDDNQFLYSDLIHYDSEKRTVNSPGKTRLTGEDVEINGGSLDYDIPTRSYVIGNRVHCILKGFVEP